jgi:hypothetical protein
MISELPREREFFTLRLPGGNPAGAFPRGGSVQQLLVIM